MLFNAQSLFDFSAIYNKKPSCSSPVSLHNKIGCNVVT